MSGARNAVAPCRIPFIQAAGCSPMSLPPSHFHAMLLKSREPHTFFCEYCQCRFQHDADATGTHVACPSCDIGLAAPPHISAVHLAKWKSSVPTVARAVRQSPARPRAQKRHLTQPIVLWHWRESVWQQALGPALTIARVAGFLGVIGAFRSDGTLFDRYIAWIICGWCLFAVGFVVAYVVALAVYAARHLATASAGRSQSLPSACF